MTVPVRYTCPFCGAVATLERDPYLADKCVTQYALDGWEYADAHEPFEDADGVTLVCGASETDGEGCGRTYYLSFVKYEQGREVDAAVPLKPGDMPDFNFRR
jgi:hypothetical protein